MSYTDYIRVNFILPKELYHSLKVLIPERRRSKVVSSWIQEHIEKMEDVLYKVAKAVEKDKTLNREMKDWDVTLTDGLEEWEWK